MEIYLKNDTDLSAPVRIAQILGKMEGGGIEQVVMNYYRHIDRSRLQFDFFIFEGSGHVPEAEIESLGGRVYRLCHIKNAQRYIKSLSALLKQNGYRIAHCHLGTLSAPALLAAKKAGVPVRIIHNHSASGGRKELVRNLAKAALKRVCGTNATHRLACSQYAARWMFGSAPLCDLLCENAPKGSVSILRNAIDGSAFRRDRQKRDSLRAELEIPHDALVFGHIGRFCPQKNQSFLVKLFCEIHRLHPNSYLLMAGTGADIELVRAEIVAYGLSGSALLLGQRGDTDRLYNAFDCFVLPSNYEGLCVVGVEAQAVGVSCVFSDKITDEVKISDNVSFISLKAPLEEWAKAALAAAQSSALPADLTAHGYEIHTEAQKLEKYYLEKICRLKCGERNNND